MQLERTTHIRLSVKVAGVMCKTPKHQVTKGTAIITLAIACASLVVCVAEGQGIVPGAVDDLHLLIQANQKDYAALRDKMLSETPGPWDVAELHRRLEWPERVAPAGEDFVVVRRIESGIRRG